MTSIGWGSDPDPDDLYAAALESLTPVKSLERVGATARFIVGTVSVVGVALTGLGLVSIPRLLDEPVLHGLAIAAVVLSIVAVLLALIYVTVRVETLSIGNLAAVETYISRQLNWAWLATIAGILLILSVALAGTTAVLALALPDKPVAQVDFGVADGSAGRTVDARVRVAHLRRGDVVAVIITADSAQGSASLYTGRAAPGPDGVASVTASASAAPSARSFSMEIAVNGKPLTAVDLPIDR